MSPPPETAPYRGILFDVDGTLIGLRPPPEFFYQAVCREYGLPCPPELLRQARPLAVDFMLRHGLDYLDDEMGMWRQANRRVFGHLGAGPQAEDCARRFEQRFRQEAEDYAYPDAVPTLQELQRRGLLLGALTGRLHSSEALLARLGLRRYFSFYLYAGELGVFKPDPRMYQEALRRSRLPAAEVLLVGDRASDVRGARSMGLASLLICREGAPPAADAPSLSDLRELLDWF